MNHPIKQLVHSIEFRSDRRLRLLGIGLLILAGVACFMSLAAFPQKESSPQGWAPYLASTALLMAAAYALIPYKKTGPQLEPFSFQVILIGAFILALAVFMRLFHVATLPFGTWNDEAYIGMIARNILSDPSYRPIYITGYDHPLHFYALVAFAFKLFGDSTASIRLVTALFGVATVAVAFLAGRETMGNRLGLLMAFLLAISRWHITFSRFGVYTITMPFFELLVIWLLLRSRRTFQIHDFLWAGLAFGYALNFYVGIRLFVPVIVLYIVFWLIDTLRHRAMPETISWPSLLIGLLGMAIAAWFAVAPVAQFALTHPEDFWSRSNQVSIFSQYERSDVPKALYASIIKHALMFNLRGDANGRHNLSGEPMLDPLTGILFLIGFVLACLHIRRPTNSLFLMLFAFNMLGGILTLDFEAPQANRVLGSISAVIFFAALGAETIWHRLETSARVPQARRRFILTLATLGFGGFIIAYNATTYFVRQANSDRTWLEFNGTQTLTAQNMLKADPAHTTIYASVYLNKHEVVGYLAPQIKDSQGIIPPIGLPVRESGDKPVAIFVDPNNTWILDEARQFYPDAQFQIDNTPSGDPALYSIFLSREDVQRLQGVTAQYWSGDVIQGAAALVQDEKSIRSEWLNQPPIASPFVARLETTLYAPLSGEYELVLQTPDQASLWLDEQLILSGFGEQRSMQQLAQGDHSLRIEARSGNGLVDLLWRAPDAQGKLADNPGPIPVSSLYLPALVPVHGLLGNYFHGENWSGQPAFSRIDPFLDMYIHITPLERPYTVDWSGQIDIPEGGEWKFELLINGQAQVFIENQLVVDTAETSEDMQGLITLKAGQHSIQVRFLDYLGGSLIHLYWTAPGGEQQIVPSSALVPYP